MSLETIIASQSYTGNGSTSTPYEIPFTFLAPEHIKVTVRDAGAETTLGLGEFTVTRLPSGKGRFVTTQAWSSNHEVKVTRVTPTTQPMVLEDGALIPAKTLERAFDRLSMIAQETRNYTGSQETEKHAVNHTLEGDDKLFLAMQQVTGLEIALQAKASNADLDGHAGRTDNPHEVTKEQVGLPYADNTADIDKPISEAMQEALDDKVPMTCSVTGAGLASGGGDLSASRIITVPVATQAEAIAGTLDDKAMTPLKVAQAMAPRLVTRTASYTLEIGDGDGRTLVDMDNADPLFLTIPPQDDVALPLMRTIAVRQKGAGTVTFVPGDDVTIQSEDGLLSISGQHAGAALIQISTDVWWLVGSLA
jgi:hypothetical protein